MHQRHLLVGKQKLLGGTPLGERKNEPHTAGTCVILFLNTGSQCVKLFSLKPQRELGSGCLVRGRKRTLQLFPMSWQRKGTLLRPFMGNALYLLEFKTLEIGK